MGRVTSIISIFALFFSLIYVQAAYASHCGGSCYDPYSGETNTCAPTQYCQADNPCAVIGESCPGYFCYSDATCSHPTTKTVTSSKCSEVNACQQYVTYSDGSYEYKNDDSCTSLCSKSPECVSSTILRTYSGTCSGGSCSYSDTSCTYGCSNGACNQPPCSPNWSCTSWSSCSASYTDICTNSATGTRTRTCTDLNKCGTISGKPSESQSCTITRNTDGTVCSTGSCILSSGTCGTGSRTVTKCSSGKCQSSSTESCPVGCPTGYICSGGNCIVADTTSPTVTNVKVKNVAFPGQPYHLGDLIDVSADVSDNTGVMSCTLKIGETQVGEMKLSSSPCTSCLSSRTYTLENPPIVPAKEYIVTVACKDAVGNSGQGSTSMYVGSSSIDLVKATFLPPNDASVPRMWMLNTIVEDKPGVTVEWGISGANCYLFSANDITTGLPLVTPEKPTSSNRELDVELGRDIQWIVEASADNCQTYETKSILHFYTKGDNSPRSDTANVGSCSVSITTKTELNAKYLDWGVGINQRAAVVDADSTGTTPKLTFLNSWTVDAPKITVTSKETKRDGTDAKYGYTLSSNCKFLKVESCTTGKAACAPVTGIGTNAVSLFQDSSYSYSTVTYRVGECLTNSYCESVYGTGFICGNNTNMCEPSRPTSEECTTSSSECPPNKCCTSDNALGDRAITDSRDPNYRKCVDKGTVKSPYICTSQ